MRFDDFIKELELSGWSATSDAQHYNIKKLWIKMYPIISELENEVFELECIVNP